MADPDSDFIPGDVVSGLEPSELVEIQRVAPFGSKVLVEGIGILSRRLIRRPLSPEVLASLTKVRGKTFTLRGDPLLFLLGAEAERIRTAYHFDPLFAVNSSIVDPLPHQVEAVYRYLLPLPRIRFLLADDTGAGKTIMTGLLIKELLFRGSIQKILIITPGGLTKQWLEEVPLVTLIEEAIDSESTDQVPEKTEATLDTASRERAERLIALQKKSSLASRLDLRAARELRDASDERRLQPMFIQRFFARAWAACGGTMRPDEHFPVWHLGPTPSGLLEIARERRLPMAEKYDTPFVFDKYLVSVASKVRVPEQTRLMGPGHILFDVLIEWAIRSAQHAFAQGVVLTDPSISSPQRLWLVRSCIEDQRPRPKAGRETPAHERLAVAVLDSLGLRATSPACLLNCLPPEEDINAAGVEARSAEEIQAWAYEQITEKQLAQVEKLRAEECELRRQYLNTAFTDLIVELQGELNDLQQEDLFGAHNQEETDRLRSRIEALKARKAERLKELELMMKLNANLPEILTEAIVLPTAVATDEGEPYPTLKGAPMRRDDEVEALAMEMAMCYERRRGWTPFDVSKDGEHYDIRSEGSEGEKRFIEVKGRAQTGAIILTGPEVDKLHQLGERAWLYIATFCKGECPRLRVIQDPIAKLDTEMLYRQVQYLVAEKEWRRCGEELELPVDRGPQ